MFDDKYASDQPPETIKEKIKAKKYQAFAKSYAKQLKDKGVVNG